MEEGEGEALQAASGDSPGLGGAPSLGVSLEAAVAGTRGLKLGTSVEPQAHEAPLEQDGVGGAGRG